MLLSTQYRMHPAISDLPSDLFYAGRISDGVRVSDRPIPAGFNWPRADWPIALVPVSGLEQNEVPPPCSSPRSIYIMYTPTRVECTH